MNGGEVKNSFNHPYSSEISQIKGELAVEKVLLVLESLKRRKTIMNFGSTDAFTRDDSFGIDVIIYPIWGGKILLQIKSSFNLGQKKRYNRRGIYYLAVPPKMEQYVVEAKVSGILMNRYRRMIRRKERRGKI